MKVWVFPSKLYNICVLPIEDTIHNEFMFRLLNNIFFQSKLWLKCYIFTFLRAKANRTGKGWGIVKLGWHEKNGIHMASNTRSFALATSSADGILWGSPRIWIWRIHHSKRLESKSPNLISALVYFPTPLNIKLQRLPG